MHAEYLKSLQESGAWTDAERLWKGCQSTVHPWDLVSGLTGCHQKLQASASEERERVVSQDARPRATNVLTRRNWYLFKCQFGMTCEGAKYHQNVSFCCRQHFDSKVAT